MTLRSGDIFSVGFLIREKRVQWQEMKGEEMFEEERGMMQRAPHTMNSQDGSSEDEPHLDADEERRKDQRKKMKLQITLI